MLISIIIGFIIAFVLGKKTVKNIKENGAVDINIELQSPATKSEEDLIDQLKYYGYCKEDTECKKTGSFKVYKKDNDEFYK